MFSSLSSMWTSMWSADEAAPSSRAPPLCESSEPEERTFLGHVTSLHDGYGLIDNETYFSAGVVVGDASCAVGDAVSVRAERKPATGGWRAKQVTPVTQADAGDDDDGDDGWVETTQEAEPEPDGNVVAVVTSVQAQSGFLDDTTPFDLADVAPGYVPVKGDSVAARVRSTDGRGRRAFGVAPLRTMDFVGDVSAVMASFGYVECDSGDVYFELRVCGREWAPARGQRVRGRAVETNRGRCGWRAFQLAHEERKPAASWLSQ